VAFCSSPIVPYHVMPGLVPGIHVSVSRSNKGMDGRHGRAEATPPFGRPWSGHDERAREYRGWFECAASV
jgi:hypothetical protein